MGRKDSVFVTLADRNYLSQAKQLFASAHLEGMWGGDYLLLAHEVPRRELAWFRDRGIHVKECRQVGTALPRKGSIISMSKLYLFTPYFRRWAHVVFLDADMMVRGSLEALAKARGFNAVRDVSPSGFNFRKPEDRRHERLYASLKRQYREVPFFNSGLMAFETSSIAPTAFDRLRRIYLRLSPVIYGDQAVLNIAFRDSWKELLPIFNIFELCMVDAAPFTDRKQVLLGKGYLFPVVHFCGADFPWKEESRFHAEWKDNLRRAQLIRDFGRRRTGPRRPIGEEMADTRERSRLISSMNRRYRRRWRMKRTLHAVVRVLRACGLPSYESLRQAPAGLVRRLGRKSDARRR